MKSSTSISYTKKEIAFIILGIIAFIGMVLFLILNEAKCQEQHKHTDEIIEAMHNNDTEKFLALIDDPQKSVDRASPSVMSKIICNFFIYVLRIDGSTTSNSPLEEACKMENLFYVEKLLEKGADPNRYRKDEYLPPLLLAVNYHANGENANDAKTIVEMLLAHGANVNIQDSWKKNALIFLFRFKADSKEEVQTKYELAELLIRHSIDKSHKDLHEKTAYDYAIGNNYPKYVCDLLKP